MCGCSVFLCTSGSWGTRSLTGLFIVCSNGNKLPFIHFILSLNYFKSIRNVWMLTVNDSLSLYYSHFWKGWIDFNFFIFFSLHIIWYWIYVIILLVSIRTWSVKSVIIWQIRLQTLYLSLGTLYLNAYSAAIYSYG